MALADLRIGLHGGLLTLLISNNSFDFFDLQVKYLEIVFLWRHTITIITLNPAPRCQKHFLLPHLLCSHRIQHHRLLGWTQQFLARIALIKRHFIPLETHRRLIQPQKLHAVVLRETTLATLPAADARTILKERGGPTALTQSSCVGDWMISPNDLVELLLLLAGNPGSLTDSCRVQFYMSLHLFLELYLFMKFLFPFKLLRLIEYLLTILLS